jgi:hypothetical protein
MLPSITPGRLPQTHLTAAASSIPRQISTQDLRIGMR